MTTSPVKALTEDSDRPNNPSTVVGHVIECGTCHQANHPDRRFCSKCGGSLRHKCLQCGAEGAGNETFCGNCGTNFQELITAKIAHIDSTIQRAQELHRAGDHTQAIAILRSLPSEEHVEIRKRLGEAERLITSLSEERTRLTSDAESAARQAEQLIDVQRYQDALLTLQGIPVPLQNDRWRKLWQIANTTFREIKCLQSAIAREVEARRWLQLTPHINRYLNLQPKDEKIHGLAKRVRDSVVAKVRQAISSADYEQAGKLLECVPLSAIDESTQKLQQEVRELLRLHQELRTAPNVDKSLLTIAQRLIQLAPQDAKIPQLLVELTKRLQRGPRDSRSPIIPWAATPPSSQLGPPVDVLGGFSRLQAASPPIETDLRQHPGMFFVAAGLALQGLGLAPISINLLPAVESNGLFRKLGRLRKTTTFKIAWGVDIGCSGVKAIKLNIRDNSTSGVSISKLQYIPHRINLNNPAAESKRTEIVSETLQKWHELCQPADEEAICVNAPATKTLGRFFQVPSIKSAKLAEIVTLQVSQQIPYALSDLNWGYQRLGDAENGHEQGPVAGLQSVIVAALRTSDASSHISPFTQLGLPVHLLQSESIALHNLLVHDQFTEAPTKESTREKETIALLDIGSDATNFVISSRSQVWFRTIHHGGNDVNQAFTREFKLTFVQAEEIKRNLEKAHRLGAVLETLEQVAAKLLSEAQRTLETFKNEQAEQVIRRIYLCGGAAAQFGFLRQFRTGSLRGGEWLGGAE